MNIITCSVQDGSLHSVDGDFRYRLSATHMTAIADRSQVHFGLRAEDIQIVAEDQPDADVAGEIMNREPLGDETIYLINAHEQRLLVKADPKLNFKRGETVALKFNPNRIHLFDFDTEQSLLSLEEPENV